MIDDPSELELAFLGTLLEGRAVSSVELPDRAGSVLLVDCNGGEAREAWSAARSVLDTTERWPLVAFSFGLGVDDDFTYRSQLEFGGASAGQILDEIARRSDADSIDSFTKKLHSSNVFAPRYNESTSYLRLALETLEHRVGRSPTESDVRSAIGGSATDPQLELFLHDWERANALVQATGAVGDDWFVPMPDDEVGAIALIPTARHFESVAHLGFYGANGEQAALGGVLRSWGERFGAELVANFGTMLHFAVERPPTDFDAAFNLACEHYSVASRTLEGFSIREYARSLIGRRTWFLHERP